MTTRAIIWSDEIWAIAKAHADRGLGPTRIGELLGYDYKTVQRNFARRGEPLTPGSNAWAKQEVAVLQRMVEKGFDNRDISAALKEYGFKRTASAVQSKRAQLAFRAEVPAKPYNYNQATSGAGWPTMRGTEEERDERFVRLVRAAGGTPVAVKGMGWVWPVLQEARAAA